MDYKIENTAVYPNKRYQILSGSTLKLIALIVMFIDHVGAVILLNLPELGYISEEYYELWYRCYRITRNIGRSAFPIFCFLLVEGFCHTHSKAKYALRLFAFALISQIPYSLAIVGEFSLQDTNVFFTLLLGLLTIWGMSEADRYVRDEFLNLLIKALCVATGCMTAYILKTDYDYQGILLIAILYIFRFCLL